LHHHNVAVRIFVKQWSWINMLHIQPIQSEDGTTAMVN
jgi:hypothetical protein